MNAILKQFEGLGISLKRSEFQWATIRLTFYYTAGIAIILIISSVIIYGLFTPASLVRVPDEHDVVRDEVVRAAEGELNLGEVREHLLDILVLVDLSVLVLASFASYFLAKNTLFPIEAVYRRQERFVGNVAHELRTPLAVLKSGAESLLRKERENLEYRHFISESLDEVNRMARLSDDLLFLLRHQTGHSEEFSKVDVAEIARRQVLQFLAYAEEKHVSVHTEVPESVIVAGVHDDLVRVFQNVIKNAIDYNRDGGTVTVSITDEGSAAILKVTDTGVGIAGADLPHVFERFYKADTSRKQSYDTGSGLGLSIVNDIVNAHGGTVSLTSEPGKGTQVEITLKKVF